MRSFDNENTSKFIKHILVIMRLILKMANITNIEYKIKLTFINYNFKVVIKSSIVLISNSGLK